MVTQSEFSYPLKILELGGKIRNILLSADKPQLAALAKRFDLAALERLDAEIMLSIEGSEISANGQLEASLVQNCIASNEPVPAVISEPVSIRFIPEPQIDQEEYEILAEDCDVMFHDGQVIDLGEAIAQSLGLALDPYPRSPNADIILKAAGVKREDEDESGPFSVLASLKKKLAEE